MSVTPAGWYPDPENPAQVRYWDGQSWSDSTAPAAPAAPSDPMPPTPPAYPSYASYPSDPAGQPAPPNPSNTLSIIGIVCGAVGFIVCPVILCVAGLVLGFVARSKKESLANVALIVSAVGLVGGIILGIVVTNSMGNL